MDLKTYLDGERGRAARLAKDMEVTPVTVHGWANGRIPADRCPEIERLTKGMVPCEHQRPDVNWAVLRNSNCQEAAA